MDAAKKKPGRQPLPASMKRNLNILIAYSPSEYELARRLCEEAGIPYFAEFVRKRSLTPDEKSTGQPLAS